MNQYKFYDSAPTPTMGLICMLENNLKLKYFIIS